jgi:hypothetical protein
MSWTKINAKRTNLPKQFGPILVICSDCSKHAQIAYFESNNSFYNGGGWYNGRIIDKFVTHWHYLPDLPNKL